MAKFEPYRGVVDPIRIIQAKRAQTRLDENNKPAIINGYDLGTWVVAEEALKVKVQHLSGHQRLGPGYTRCGKTVGRKAPLVGLRSCEICVASQADEGFRAREDDLLRKNYAAMRDAKIKVEEALLKNETYIIHLKEENLAVGQEREQAQAELRRVTAQLAQAELELAEARCSPIRFWLRRLLFQRAA